MRIWLKDSERRPDPAPVATDDRAAMLAGIVLWVIALAGLLVALPWVVERELQWWLWTCVAGVGLGIIGLLYTHARRDKSER